MIVNNAGRNRRNSSGNVTDRLGFFATKKCRMQNAECRVQNAECRMQNAECQGGRVVHAFPLEKNTCITAGNGLLLNR